MAAQTITCDFEGCATPEGTPTPANWLVSRQDQGETLAWCDLHYLDLCRALVLQVDGLAEPEPGPAPAIVDEPDDEDEDADAIARLEGERARDPQLAASDGFTAGLAAGLELDTVDDSQPVAEAADQGPQAAEDPQGPSVAPEQPGEPVEGPGPAPLLAPSEAAGPAVVKRGQSSSRRKHEAKKRAKARAAGESVSPG